MDTNSNNMAKAKPFIKWVGGKGQLIEQLDSLLPEDFENWEDVTYIEPFIGGGAMLFYMLQRYPNIKHAVINDVNPDLTNLYSVVRDFPESLIESLSYIENKYFVLQSDEERREFYLKHRDWYNAKNNDYIENAALFIFLNKTCFNGLYRVNKKGLFNVPFGKYKNPKICDSDTIRKDSELLQRVEILTGDFEKTFDYAKGNTLFYFDPPYRPLTKTSEKALNLVLGGSCSYIDDDGSIMRYATRKGEKWDSLQPKQSDNPISLAKQEYCYLFEDGNWKWLDNGEWKVF